MVEIQGIMTLFIFSFIGIYMDVWFLLNLFSYKKRLFEKKVAVNHPSISILIPAYNAGKTIARCLKSLVKVNYPKKIEIIVISNGSTDKTNSIVKKFPNVKLLNLPKPNKADALNAGLNIARGEIIGIVDADTYVTRDSVKKMIGYFDDEKIGAVTSNIRVDHRTKVLTRFQNIEYMISALTKKLFTFLNSLYLAPGALSLFKGNIIKKIKFNSDTMTEDFDLALSIIKKGYKIQNSLNSNVITEIPKTLKDFVKQRIRWYRGFFQTTFKHKDLLLNKNHKTLAWFVLLFGGYLGILIGMYLTTITLVNLIQSLIIFIKTNYATTFFDSTYVSISSLPQYFTALYFPYQLINFLIIFTGALLVYTIILKAFRSANKRNYLILPFFVILYYSLIMFIWVAALFLELVRWKKRW